jgi:hypothetical protein
VNYYQPREHKDGGWHYTCRNDDRIWPVGYCSDHPAHPTRDEAYECYRQYLLDTARYDQRIVDQQLRCEVCGTFTDRLVDVGPGSVNSYMLCDEHHNREALEGLVQVGDAVSSW